MPRDRYMEPKSRTSLIKFGLVGGIEADTDPARVRVLDSNNVFPSPNGTEAGPRPGCEIRKRYRVTTSPVGRKAIVIETAPPDVALGNLIMVINTENGRNAIEAGAFVRDRTQLPLQSDVSNVSLTTETRSVSIGDPVPCFVSRTGPNLSLPVTVTVFALDGTAVRGVDYTGPASASATFTENWDPANLLNFSSHWDVVSDPGAAGKTFILLLESDPPGIPGPIDVTTVTTKL